MRLIRAACQRGVAGVVVTHDAQLASWADRVVFLRDGRVVDQTARRRPVPSRCWNPTPELMTTAARDAPRRRPQPRPGGGAPARRAIIALGVAAVPARVAPAGTRAGAAHRRRRGDDRRARAGRATSNLQADADVRDGQHHHRLARPGPLALPRTSRRSRQRFRHRRGRSSTPTSRCPARSRRSTFGPRTRTGSFGHAMLRLVSGRYPTGPGEVAVTGGVATTFGLHARRAWTGERPDATRRRHRREPARTCTTSSPSSLRARSARRPATLLDPDSSGQSAEPPVVPAPPAAPASRRSMPRCDRAQRRRTGAAVLAARHHRAARSSACWRSPASP